MALRDSLPSAWLVAVAVVGGLAAGVVLGKVAPPERPPAPPPVPPPAPAPPGPDGGAGGTPAPGPGFRIPGGPPPEIAREMEEALRGSFAGDSMDPAERAAQDAAFARVEALTARWAAESPRSPLASTAWWRAALRRTLAPEPPGPPGWTEETVTFLDEVIPVRVSYPAGTGGAPVPVILCVVDSVLDPEGLMEEQYGPLLGSHAVVAVLLRHPREEPVDPVMEDPRTAMLGVVQAARRWALDRDRVVVDGFGRGAGVAADLAADSARQFCGAVLRAPVALGRPAENLSLNPLLLLGPEAPDGAVAAAAAAAREAQPGLRFLPSDDFAGGYLDRAAEVREWIAALPPRAVADPRYAYAWASVTGNRWLSWGHWFVVRRTRGFGPDRVVRVRIERDPERNAVLLETEEVSEILLLLNDEGLDLDRPVRVYANGELVAERVVERSLATVRDWAGMGERTLFAPAEWTLRLE